jgi:alpha-tubulin suppressor-like RCC1 family protein
MPHAGKIIGWGRNEYSELGPISSDSHSSPHTLDFLEFPEIETDPVENIVCGGNHSMVLTKSGNLYAWGYNKSGVIGDGTTESTRIPKLVMGRVKHVAAGGSHVLAMDEDGGLWAWGDNSAGQCGHGDFVRLQLTPKKIKFFEESRIVLAGFRCGDFFSYGLSIDGDLFTWGFRHQAGFADSPMDCVDVKSPKKIEKFKFFLPVRRDRVWVAIFRWLFLGRQDSNSGFSRVPAEVMFCMTEIIWHSE